MLNKELHTDIVKEYGAYDRESIAQNLWQCTYLINPKCNIAVEPKTREECYRKDHRK